MNPNSGQVRTSLIFTLLALVAVNALVVTLLLKMSALSGGEDLDVAQRFMKAIEVGSGFTTEEREQTGYEEAWELLREDRRKETDFQDFLSFFESRITDHGFLNSWYREPEESGGLGDRQLSFIVYYRDLEGMETPIRYQLRLEREEHYEVTDYEASGPLVGLGRNK